MKKFGFSLVELMVALIIVSCIVSALAPVITKKLKNNSVYISQQKMFNSNIFKEYTQSGEFELTVPEGVHAMDVILISGGDGGNYGENHIGKSEITQIGESIFNVPAYLKNKFALITMCGAGGGGGGMATNICYGGYTQFAGAGGGGSGGFYKNKLVQIENQNAIQVYVGGGGRTPKGGDPDGTYPGEGDIYWHNCLEVGNCHESGLVNNSPLGQGGKGGNTQWRGGALAASRGGSLAGGHGRAFIGNCSLAGGGGGGGGATRFGIKTERHYLIAGGGGGGGGEGFIADSSAGRIAAIPGLPGGGGGGYDEKNSSVLGGDGGTGCEWDYGCAARGGSGGKPNGNNGTISGCNNNAYTTSTIKVATSGKGGDSPLEDYPNYCRGGYGSGYNHACDSRNYNDACYKNRWATRDSSYSTENKGLDGVIVISYITGEKSGRGGNSGRKITKKINVQAHDKIKIIIGEGGSGAKSSYIDENGTTKERVEAQKGTPSKLFLNNVEILNTDDASATIAQSEQGEAILGSFGAIHSGFSGCVGGEGGNESSPKGKNATGYGGCGGGGGYIASDGGNGTIGYAKISWEY